MSKDIVSPEKLLGSKSCSFCLISWSWTTSEGVADGEDSQSAEGVQGEEDEDGEGDQAVHDLSLEPPQVQLCDGHAGIQM